MSETIKTTGDLRTLIDEEVDVVSGGAMQDYMDTCRYAGANVYEQWIADYFHVYL